MTSSPANRTALREEENRPAPASQQVIASAVTGPTPYSRAASTLAPVRCRAASSSWCRTTCSRASSAVEHLQGGGDLQLPGRGQVGGGRGPQPGQTLLGAQRALAQRRGALVEQHRVDALHPGGVLGAQVVVQLQQRPALQDDRPGGIQHSGSRPSASSIRRCRESVLSSLTTTEGKRSHALGDHQRVCAGRGAGVVTVCPATSEMRACPGGRRRRGERRSGPSGRAGVRRRCG